METKRTLIARRQPHHNNVIRVFSVGFRRNELHDLIVDDACIRVIDGSVPTKQQLRVIVLIKICLEEELAELGVRIDDIWNSFGRVESSDLHNVIACRPLKFMHLLFRTQATEFAHIVLRIPRVKVLVEPVKPIDAFVNMHVLAIRRQQAHMSVAAPNNASFSVGTSLGTNLLTG
jgi:hypothetical protein